MLKVKRKNNSRQLKVSEQLKRVLAEIFQSHNFRGIEDQNIFLTVSEVNVSSDLKNAYIFISPLTLNQCGLNNKELLELIYNDQYILKKKLVASVSLRFMPKLIFQIDELFSQTRKIENLFKKPNIAQDIS